MKTTAHKRIETSEVEPLRQPRWRYESGLISWTDKFLDKDETIPKNSFLARRYDTDLLNEFAANHGIYQIKLLSKDVIKDFIDAQLRSKSINTVGRIYSTLRQFFLFLTDSGVLACSKDPFKQLKLSSFQTKKLPLTTSTVMNSKYDERVEKTLLKNAKAMLHDESYDKRYRDNAILMMILEASLFPSQIAALKMKQLKLDSDSGEGVIRDVTEGRRRAVHDIVLSKNVVQALRLYVDKDRPSAEGYIFPGHDGKQMSRVHLWRILKRFSQGAPQGGITSISAASTASRELRRMLIRKMHRMNLSAVEIARKMNCEDVRCAQHF